MQLLPRFERQRPGGNRLENCGLAAVVWPGKNNVACQIESFLLKSFKPAQDDFLDHFVSSSFLTTSNSLPRGSITFTAICWCSPAGKGALMVPAK